MLAWLTRGRRRVTTRYPADPEPPPPGFHGPVTITAAAAAAADGATASLCPTGAILVDPGGYYAVDRGRCIQCGACVRADPGRFHFAEAYETASRTREGLIVDGAPERNGRAPREM